MLNGVGRIVIGSLVFILFAGLVPAIKPVFAWCDPPECSVSSNCDPGGAGGSCRQKCCVWPPPDDGGGGGGGGGGGTTTCPAGTVQVRLGTYFCSEYRCAFPNYMSPARYMGCTPEQLDEWNWFDCERGACVPICDDIAPTSITVTATGASTATMSWTNGSNGTYNLVRVGPNEADVRNGCGGGTCVAVATLPTTQQSYNVSGLVNGTTYYYRAVEYSDSTCWKDLVVSRVHNAPASCTINLSPSAPTIQQGGTQLMTANVVPTFGTITSVAFSSTNTGVVTVPTTPKTAPFAVTATGVGPGSAIINATATMNTGATCATSAATDSNVTVAANTINGQVYYIPDGTSCVPGGASAPPFGGSTVTVGSTTVGVNASGAYSLTTASPGFYTVNLDIGSASSTYTCASCDSNCFTKTSVQSPTSTPVTHYVTDILMGEAWWQAVGAGVYAGSTSGGVTIRSQIANSGEYLIIPGTQDLAALVRAAGNVDTGEGNISTANWSARSTYQGKKMDYRFFASQMGVTPGTENAFDTGEINEAEIAGTTEEFYLAEDGDGEVTLGSPWVVTSGESYVIFVDGDLRINQSVVVNPGGFLAFIVNGDVTVTSGTNTVQGIYVMDEMFVTETDAAQLSVEGMVVAWGGVDLNRDLGGITNYDTPAEQFIYRPDFIVNMPEEMKNFALRWREVAPGTFE